MFPCISLALSFHLVRVIRVPRVTGVPVDSPMSDIACRMVEVECEIL